MARSNSAAACDPGQPFGDAFWSLPCGEWDVIGIDIQALAAEKDVEELWDWLDGVLATSRPAMCCMHRTLTPLSACGTDEPLRYVTGELHGRCSRSDERQCHTEDLGPRHRPPEAGHESCAVDDESVGADQGDGDAEEDAVRGHAGRLDEERR